MMSKFSLGVSPSLLKKLDSVFGRIAATVLPKPCRKSTAPPIASILVIRPGGIGDAALSAPLVAVLKDRYPAADIDILAEQRNAGVFALIPGITSLFLYDRPADLLNAIRRKYDLIIDTEQWHRLSAVITRLNAPGIAIGFATNERSRLFTHSVPYSHACYEAQSFLNLVVPLGIQVIFDPAIHFLVVPGDAAQEIARLPDYRPELKTVTVFPGASISERLWGTTKFRGLASLFIKSGFLPILIGGSSEKMAGDEIVADGGINYAGRTSLAGSAYLISRSSLLVSGDSGILHIGAGLGIPTVSLFGPGIEDKWSPRGVNNAVINKRTACSPCTRFGNTPECPHQVRCMAQISVEDVYSAAIALLNKIQFSATIRNPIVG